MSGIIGASITYRLALGLHAGKKVLTLQAVPVSSHRKKASELVSKSAWPSRVRAGTTGPLTLPSAPQAPH